MRRLLSLSFIHVVFMASRNRRCKRHETILVNPLVLYLNNTILMWLKGSKGYLGHQYSEHSKIKVVCFNYDYDTNFFRFAMPAYFFCAYNSKTLDDNMT